MKDKIIGIIFITIICGFFLLNIIKKDNEISLEQRRKLATFPKLNISNIQNTSFAKGLDKYVVDQFVYNQEFRKIKAQIVYNILNKKENNDIFVSDNRLYKLEYPLNEKSVDNFNTVMNKVKSKLNNGNNPNNRNNTNNTNNRNNIYISIIPDKNYYLDEQVPKMQYNRLFTQVIENAKRENIQYIDITKDLNLNSYYNTDTHWKQEKLGNVVKTLNQEINNKIETKNKTEKEIKIKNENTKEEYQKKEYNNFAGVYLGQSALNIPTEKLTYLTNDTIENATVTSIEDKNILPIYNEDKLGGMDSYDVFLSGAKALLAIENKEEKTEKELIIFRDSFGSSIAPLLIEDYSKIILVDLRYITLDMALENIQLKDNQDVLLLYSTLVINNSFTLK